MHLHNSLPRSLPGYPRLSAAIMVAVLITAMIEPRPSFGGEPQGGVASCPFGKCEKAEILPWRGNRSG